MLNVQEYSKEVEDDVLSFVHSFLRTAIHHLRNEVLFYLTLDNASLMDRASWDLFHRLYSDCDQLVMILCLQSSASGSESLGGGSSKMSFKVSSHASRFYAENLAPFEVEIFNVFEVDPLGDYELRELLIDLAQDY